MFDNVCKFLIENFSTDFTTWLLGEPVLLSELSPTELSLEPIRADALVLLQSTETVLHVEFQTRADPNMPFRMLDYCLRVHRRFPDKTLKQVVIYLKPSQSPDVFQTTFELPRTRHEFDVIRLWEQSPSIFLSDTGLLPFAALANTSDRLGVLRQVASKIDQLTDRKLQSNVSASTSILSALLLDKALVTQILRKDIMQESAIYQEIKAEGREEGREEGERVAVLRILAKKLGELPDEITVQVRELSQSRLSDLESDIFSFTTLADLTAWMQS